jgi:hypothetical protein
MKILNKLTTFYIIPQSIVVNFALSFVQYPLQKIV